MVMKNPRRHVSWVVRMETARLVGNVAAEIPGALELCRYLMNDKDPDVRCHASFGLARAGVFSQDVWLALSEFKGLNTKIEEFVEEWLETVPSARKRLPVKIESGYWHDTYKPFLDCVIAPFTTLGRSLEENPASMVDFLVGAIEKAERQKIVAICEKLVRQDKITKSEARALKDFGRAKQEDGEGQRAIRDLLFRWIFTNLEMQAVTLPYAAKGGHSA